MIKTSLMTGLVLGFVTATTAYAVDSYTLKNKAARVYEIINQRADRLSLNEAQKVDSLLDEALDTLNGRDNGHRPPPYDGGHRPGPRPPHNRPDLYEAECHIDDDLQFDFGQKVEKLTSYSIKALVQDCQFLAEASYKQNGSSGLKNIKLIGTIPSYYQTAVCHIDDDAQFDFDQIVIGVIADDSVEDLAESCAIMASSAYQLNGSSGLKNINAGRTPPVGYKSAECWIDDDPQFDAGQTQAGIIWGRGIAELTRQCDAIAKAVYKGNGSSGLANVKNN